MSSFVRPLLRSLQYQRRAEQAQDLTDRTGEIGAPIAPPAAGTEPLAPFYLMSERVLMDNPPRQQKMTGQQMRKYLQEQGVKPEEFQYTRLGEYLESNPKGVTVDDTLAFIENNYPAGYETLYTDNYLENDPRIHGYAPFGSESPQYESYTAPGAAESYAVRTLHWPLTPEQQDISRFPSHFTETRQQAPTVDDGETAPYTGEIMHIREKQRPAFGGEMTFAEELQSDPHKTAYSVDKLRRDRAEREQLVAQKADMQRRMYAAAEAKRTILSPQHGLPNPMSGDQIRQRLDEISTVEDQLLQDIQPVEDRLRQLDSDIGMATSRHGFVNQFQGGALPTEDRQALRERLGVAQQHVTDLDREWGKAVSEGRRAEAAQLEAQLAPWKLERDNLQQQLAYQMPDLPFRKDFPALGMKRMITEAVQESDTPQVGMAPGWFHAQHYGGGRDEMAEGRVYEASLDNDGDLIINEMDPDYGHRDHFYISSSDLDRWDDLTPAERDEALSGLPDVVREEMNIDALVAMRNDAIPRPFESEREVEVETVTTNLPGGRVDEIRVPESADDPQLARTVEENFDGVKSVLEEFDAGASPWGDAAGVVPYDPSKWKWDGTDLFYADHWVTDLPLAREADPNVTNLFERMYRQLRSGELNPDNAGDMSSMVDTDYDYEPGWEVWSDALQDGATFATRQEAQEYIDDHLREQAVDAINMSGGLDENMEYAVRTSGAWLEENMTDTEKVPGFENVYDKRYLNTINQNLKQLGKRISRNRPGQEPLSEFQLRAAGRPSAPHAFFGEDTPGGTPVHGEDIPADWAEEISRYGLPLFTTAGMGVLTGAALVSSDEAQANVPRDVPGDEGALAETETPYETPYGAASRGALRSLGGVLENVRDVGLGMGAEALSGLGMLAQGVAPGVDINTQLPEQMQGLVGRIPRSETADRQMQALGAKLQELAEQYPWLAAQIAALTDPEVAGENVYRLTGSPGAAAISAGAAGSW